MAKLQYTRFDEVFNTRDKAISSLNSLSRNFAEPVMIRYYDVKGQVRTLVALYRSEMAGDYVIQFDEEVDGRCDEIEDLVYQMLDYNKELVDPDISGIWNFYNYQGLPLTLPTTPDLKNPMIEKGYKARFTGVYKWESKLGMKNPTRTTSDSMWQDLPETGQSSSQFVSGIVDKDFSVMVGIQAPKTGLIVVGDSVRLAEGVDKKYDTRKVKFMDRLYYGKSEKGKDLTEGDIKNLQTELVESREKTIKSLSTEVNEYFIYSYPKELGELSQIILNLAYPVLGAFNKTSITITNDAGKEVELLVYISNNPGAFTNATLQFI